MSEVTNGICTTRGARRLHVPTRLTKTEAEAFASKDWCSIGFIGPLATIARHADGTEGMTAVAPWLGTDWAGKAWALADRAAPMHAQGLLFRLWFDSKADAKRMLTELPAFFASRAVKLRGDWYGLPADVDLLELQIALIDFAKSCGLDVRDDDEALQTLRLFSRAA